MGSIFQLVGPNHVVQIFGVKLVGVDPDSGKKLLFSIVFVIVMMVISKALRALAKLFTSRYHVSRVVFWTRQGINVIITLLTLIGLISIWFDNPARLATAFGLVGAGLAFALQQPVAAVAGYITILRSKTFNVGDRITMGGVRGDVIALSFIQTTVMEIGEPPAIQDAKPAMWVKSWQYTGRIVTISNAKIFSDPVYNFTREFPYIWEEMSVPVAYDVKHDVAEKALLEAAGRHTVKIGELAEPALAELERRYFVKRSELQPRVFWRITANWLELTVRFLSLESGIRDLKDKMSRDILAALDKAGIGIASATYDVVGMPPLRVQVEPSPGAQEPGPAAAQLRPGAAESVGG